MTVGEHSDERATPPASPDVAAPGGGAPATGSAPDRGADALAQLEHRLRTRVTVARGWIDLLLSGRLEEPAQIEGALRTTRRQLTELEDLLRGEAIELVVDLRDLDEVGVDLREAVGATLAEYAAATAPWLRGPIVRGEPRPIAVDPAALHDALLHLLDNAVEHTPDATPVEVVLDYGRAAVELAVEDAGPGLAADVHDGGARAAGTGLEVVARLAAALGASMVSGRSSRLGGAAVRLRWER